MISLVEKGHIYLMAIRMNIFKRKILKKEEKINKRRRKREICGQEEY